MGWNAELTAASSPGAAVTFTPETTAVGAYTSGHFTAPKKGVYRFRLKGSSGGAAQAASGHDGYGNAAGGAGGLTEGYLLMEAGETVYVGAGGLCSAAYVAAADGAFAQLAAESLLFVAGGGGHGGAYHDTNNYTGYNCKSYAGGAGGGLTGGARPTERAGYPGTQSAAGAGGEPNTAGGGYAASGRTGGAGGGAGDYGYSATGGRGGDGYYGGGGGKATTAPYVGCETHGGGGGSGYVKAASVTVAGTTYANTTGAAGGAEAGACGSIEVSYHARAELPILFNGVRLTRLFFNGTEAKGLVFGGTRVFTHKLAGRRKGERACFG